MNTGKTNLHLLLKAMTLFLSLSLIHTTIAKEAVVTQYTIKQRSYAKIDALSQDTYLHIGDITASQVLVSLKSQNKILIPTTSMKQGDIIKFKVQGADAYLLLHKYNNFLFGGDYCVFQLSNKPIPKPKILVPPTTQKESI